MVGAALVVGFAAVSVTGHTVVYRGIVSVTTWPVGQFVTVGAQDVTVYTDVVCTVETVYLVVADELAVAGLVAELAELRPEVGLEMNVSAVEDPVCEVLEMEDAGEVFDEVVSSQDSVRLLELAV